MSEPVEIYSGQFELVVDLPPLENSEYHRSKAQPAPVLDDNVICLVETNEEINDDDDNKIHKRTILTTKKKQSSMTTLVTT